MCWIRHKWVEKYFKNPEEFIKKTGADEKQYGRECKKCGKKQVYIGIFDGMYNNYKWINLEGFHERFNQFGRAFDSTEEMIEKMT